jgi:uncharacterized protein
MTNWTYPPGVPCWVDTEQPDVEAAAAFYGWLNLRLDVRGRHAAGSAGPYVIAKLDGQDVGAIAGPRQGAAAWSTYVSVDDADSAAQRLVSAGATVRSVPADAGRAAVADRDQTAADAERLGAQVLGRDDTEWTRTAPIRDPQGAEFTASQFTPPSG